jgi:pyridinium-3,5-bisthiocarboxylic acid mononucleotide nickel chelatase
MMSKVVYLECPTGIAGDMCLGALVSGGVPLDYLTATLDRLGIAEEYELRANLVHRNGQQATKVHVKLKDVTPERPSHSQDHHHPHSHERLHEHSHEPKATQNHRSRSRHLPEIEQMIRGAELPPRAEAWSLAVFQQLAVAEGAVHGIVPEQVHFHEVGAIDAIVDIVGTCLGLDWLDVDQIHCSNLPTGGGTVWAAHGRLPVPVPAVLKLYEMRKVPIYSNGIERELVTPTGAAIVTTLATRFGAPPRLTLQKIGLGAGSLDLPIPNILRLWIGETDSNNEMQKSDQKERKQKESETQEVRSQPNSPVKNAFFQDSIVTLETQIDDLNPQAIGYVFERLFLAGAVDVFTQAIAMKKSRPGVLLTVICPVERVADCEKVLFRETSTLGIRHSAQQRSILGRDFQTVKTEYGSIQVKVARSQTGEVLNVQPEYEDCAEIARHHNIAWREVHRMALQTWHHQHH